MEEQLLVVLVVVAAAGMMGQWIAWRLGLPAIFVLLCLGLAIGPLSRLVVPEQDFGAMLDPMIGLAVGIIVFEGGLGLNFSELRRSGQGIRRLVGLGIPLSAGLTYIAAYYIGGFTWEVSILLASMLLITGPTVIQPLLRQAKVGMRAAAFLKWEGVLNDAIGAVLTVLVLEFILSTVATRDLTAPLIDTLVDLARGTAIAAFLGLGAGFLAAMLMRADRVPEFLKAPFVVTVVVCIYAGAHLIQHESGLIAVALFGITLANRDLPEIEDLRRFNDSLTVLLVSGLFVIIAATLEPEAFSEIGWREVLFLAALVLVVRPVATTVATMRSDMDWRERLFVGLIAPRGIVVAALATLVGSRLSQADLEGADRVLPVVFGAIILTVSLQGFLIGPLARALGLASTTRPSLVIVGSNPWTAALAQTLRRLGTPVLITDHSAEALQAAEADDISVHHGHILAPTEDAPEELKDLEYLLAATDDDAFNALICTRFASSIGQQRVFQLPYADHLDFGPEWRGRVAFGAGFTRESLLQRLKAGWRFRVCAPDDVWPQGDTDRAIAILRLLPNGDLTIASEETTATEPANAQVVIFEAPDSASIEDCKGNRRSSSPSS